MTLFVNVHEPPSGNDWMSDEVRDRLAAPLVEVPSVDPTDDDMDILLAELKSSGNSLRAALHDDAAASENRDESVTHLPKIAHKSTYTRDVAWSEFILRWSGEYRLAAQKWLFPARLGGWTWPQRRSGFDFILPLKDSADEFQPQFSSGAAGSAYLTVHIGSGKTSSTISLVERLVRKRRVFERQYDIEYFARLGDNWSACTCTHKDIEPALNIAWPGSDGGLLVMLIDFGVSFTLSDSARPSRRAAAPRTHPLPASLRRRQDRTRTKAAAPPAPSAVLVVDTSQVPDRPAGVPVSSGVGIYVPLPSHLTPASEHAHELREWWHSALTAYTEDAKGESAI
ncbi:hypothetical protein [Streptomyces sp. NBC_00268]|uniref:hypothetical protein n=1 Tax=Streptomyces sp. NBC_00268 TaxID=2975695 RepID=UPI00225844A5|nr:hypothetical protein [Streptomyces sp. NBC_00268]MCX5182615.1 hypothetical protein [Streptomyces sp. NBC_00268]